MQPVQLKYTQIGLDVNISGLIHLCAEHERHNFGTWYDYVIIYLYSTGT